MSLQEKVIKGIATPEEIKEFRNSLNPDEMGGDDLEGINLEVQASIVKSMSKTKSISSLEKDGVVVTTLSRGASSLASKSIYDYSKCSETSRKFAQLLNEEGLILVPKLTSYNFTDKNNPSRVKYIVNHYFGGLDTAESVADYFAGSYVGASAHLAIDETNKVYLCVDLEDVSWHCGDKGAGKMKGVVTNSNSIGIEVRPKKIDKSTASSAMVKDWYFEEAVVDNLIIVNRCLMKLFNLGIDKVVRHYDVTQKWCPRPWMGDDINIYYGVSGNQKWAEFIERLGEEEVTQEQFNKMFEIALNTYFAVPRGDNPSDWAKKEGCTEWSKQNKIINGDGVGNYNWQNFVTREALSAILYRGVKNGVFTNEKD